MNTIEFRNKVDMLQGCINRICVTDDEKELCTLRHYAKIYIEEIFDYRRELIVKGDIPLEYRGL